MGSQRFDEVFNYLNTYYKKHGRMPTIKRVMHELHIGSGPLYRILARLVKDGRLKKVHPAFEILYRIADD